MAINAGTVVADAKMNIRGFVRDMKTMRKKGTDAADRIEQRYRQMGRRMRNVGLGMSAAITAPVVAGFGKMAKEASLLEGAMAKFDVVFGDASDEMLDWAKEFRKEVPLSRKEIVKSAAAMQDLLVPMGIARDEATGMSKEWLTLASRLAAFNDVPVDQTLEAIRSGVAGMSRPLRQFGIDARQTAIEQEALAQGLIDAGEEMDEQTRQQALLSLAYKQSSDAVEGYEEQQGSLLLIQQDLKASVNDLATSLGKQLLPIVKSVTQSLTSVVKSMEGMSDSAKNVTLVIGGVAAAIGPLLTALGFMVGQIGNLVPLVSKLAKGIKAVTVALVTNPWYAVGAAIAFVGTKAIMANKELNNLHSNVSDIIAQGNDLDAINNAIARIGEEYKKAAKNAATIPGMEAEDLIDPKSKQQLKALVELQRELASKQMSKGISESANELDKVASTDLAKPFVDAKQPMNDIINADLPSVANLEQQFGSMNIGEAMFPPGSLGFLQEKLSALRTALRSATDPENIQGLQEKINLTQEQIDRLTGNVNESSKAWTQFGEMAGQALSQAVLHGKNLGNILANLIKQMASQVFVQGITAIITGGSSLVAGSLGSAIFGGLFHGGGMVPGTGDRMIRAQGGEMVLTQSQQRALGSMMGGGGTTVNPRAIGKEIGKQLDRRLQKLGPEDIYAMNAKGSRGY